MARLAHLVVGLCGADPLGSLRPLFGRVLALVSGGGHFAAGGLFPPQARAVADPALVTARPVATAVGAVRGDSAAGHGDQPAGGAALLYCHHTAGADWRAAGAALHFARLWPVLAGGSGAGAGAGHLELAGRSVATVVATARLVAAALCPAVAALVRLAVAPRTLDLAAGRPCAGVGVLAGTGPLAIAGTGCGAGAGGADQQGRSRHPL